MIDVCNEFYYCRQVDKKWRDERITQRVVIVFEIHPFADGVLFKDWKVSGQEFECFHDNSPYVLCVSPLAGLDKATLSIHSICLL